MTTVATTVQEVTFGADEVIVSKTDVKGHITYVNSVFVDVSGYQRADLLGRPHSIIRHPDMPGGVFRLLWQTVADGQEIFAYVKNRTRSGDFYWVLAHVTPSRDAAGRIVGYHSNRRWPDRSAIARIEPVYAWMRDQERAHSKRSEAALSSASALADRLSAAGLSYERFVWQLILNEQSGLDHV